MPIPNFVEGYPLDGSSLGSSKVQIRNNIDGTFQTLAVDHFDNNGDHGGTSGNAGAHYQAQMFSKGTTAPPAGLVNGYVTLYSATTGAGNELFMVRGNNPTGIMLTGPGSPTIAATGSTFIPGSIVVNWGKVSPLVTGTDVVTFDHAYSGAGTVYSIQITPIYTGGATVSNPTIFVVSNTATDFTYRNFSGSINGFYWMALGS